MIKILLTAREMLHPYSKLRPNAAGMVESQTAQLPVAANAFDALLARHVGGLPFLRV